PNDLIEAGQSEDVSESARGRIAEIIVRVPAFDSDIEAVVIGNFKENHLDQNLGFGPVQVGDDLADILAGLIIRDDDQPAGVRVNRNHRFADGAVIVISSAGATSGSGSSPRPPPESPPA